MTEDFHFLHQIFSCSWTFAKTGYWIQLTMYRSKMPLYSVGNKKNQSQVKTQLKVTQSTQMFTVPQGRLSWLQIKLAKCGQAPIEFLCMYNWHCMYLWPGQPALRPYLRSQILPYHVWNSSLYSRKCASSFLYKSSRPNEFYKVKTIPFFSKNSIWLKIEKFVLSVGWLLGRCIYAR